MVMTANRLYKKYGKCTPVGVWQKIYADRSMAFEVTKNDVKKGVRLEGDICPTAHGVFNGSELGAVTDSVEVGKTRVLLVNFTERVVLQFYVGPRLRKNINSFDDFNKWLELGTFSLDPVPPSLRAGYRSPGLVKYPRGVRRPRGRRVVFRIENYVNR